MECTLTILPPKYVDAAYCDRPTDQPTERETDRQTHHATPSVTIGRIYVVVKCGLIISCVIL